METKYVVFLNGSYSRKTKKIKELIKNRKIICADGGANFCYKLNILPDCIIGDLDSISKKILKYYIEKNIEIIKTDRKKDYTDFELALKYIENEEIIDLKTRFKDKKEIFSTYTNKDIIVFGATGKRVDMTLSNLKKLKNNKNMLLISEKFEYIKYKKFNNESIEITGLKDKLFSIIPISDLIDLKLEGFEYNLEKTNIKKEISLSSNVVKTDKAVISLKKGEMYIIHE